MCGRCLFSPTVSVHWHHLYCVLHVSSSCVNMCGRCLFSPTVSVLWRHLYCVLHVSSSCVNMCQMRTCLGKSWKVEIGAKERRMDDRSEVAVWLCLELWWSVEDANCCVLMHMSFLFLPSLMLAYVRCSFSKVCIMKSSACSCQVLAFILKVTERFEEWDKFCAQVSNMTSLKTCDTLKKCIQSVKLFDLLVFITSVCCCPFFYAPLPVCLFLTLVMSFPFHFGYVFSFPLWLCLFLSTLVMSFPFHFGYVFPFHFGYVFSFPLWLCLFLSTLVMSFLSTLVMSFPFHFGYVFCFPLWLCLCLFTLVIYIFSLWLYLFF